MYSKSQYGGFGTKLRTNVETDSIIDVNIGQLQEDIAQANEEFKEADKWKRQKIIQEWN